MNVEDILKRLKGIAPIPPALDYAIAACNDFLWKHQMEPIDTRTWADVFMAAAPDLSEVKLLHSKNSALPYCREHLRWIALFGREIGLFDLPTPFTKNVVNSGSRSIMSQFLKSVRGIPPELLNRAPFRQEEFVRQWLKAFAIEIETETPAVSTAKLTGLDYLRALKEAAAADVHLQKELAERNKVIARLREQEARARSNYE